MAMSQLSAVATRDIIEETLREWEDDGRAIAPIVISGNVLATLTAVRSYAQRATRFELDEIVTKLNLIEDDYIARKRSDEADRVADERRDAARSSLSDDEQRDVDTLLTEAREASERQNSTEARLTRIEGYLERIATALDKRPA